MLEYDPSSRIMQFNNFSPAKYNQVGKQSQYKPGTHKPLFGRRKTIWELQTYGYFPVEIVFFVNPNFRQSNVFSLSSWTVRNTFTFKAIDDPEQEMQHKILARMSDQHFLTHTHA